MKPKNFPARKALRKIRATYKESISGEQALELRELRLRRTKKDRTGRAKIGI